jgi:hypothetical protein
MKYAFILPKNAICVLGIIIAFDGKQKIRFLSEIGWNFDRDHFCKGC